MASPTPEVINLKGKEGHWKSNPNALYIGRPKNLPRKTKIQNYQHFGNPFVLKKESERLQVVENFESWIRGRKFQNLEQTRRLWILKNLDKVQDAQYLCCYCHPKPCHGDVLVKLVEEMSKK